MVKEYIFLALGSIAVGVVIIFIVLAVTVRMDIDINENLWVLAIPAVIALVVNIVLLELYRKFRKKK